LACEQLLVPVYGFLLFTAKDWLVNL
jgi:hypothetical protein